MSHDGKISVLCPTRERPGLLGCTIRLLRRLAAYPDRIEVLLAVDDDDNTDYEKVWKCFARRGADRIPGQIITMKRQGYEGLHQYYNELAKVATGRWLLLWNDDIFMATSNWDMALDSITQPIAVAMTESNHGKSPCTFPFFTKSYVDTIGHVSLSNHNDTWIEEVGKASGIAVEVPILVLHAYVEDDVALEGKKNIAQTSAYFYSPTMMKFRAMDVQKIKATCSRA